MKRNKREKEEVKEDIWIEKGTFIADLRETDRDRNDSMRMKVGGTCKREMPYATCMWYHVKKETCITGVLSFFLSFF